MKSFRVYRVFSSSKGVSGFGRNSYLYSIIVSDDCADYVVNPATSPEQTLKFLRERLVGIVEMLERQNSGPKDIHSWSRAAAYNLGMYKKFSLVLEIDDEAEPLANFEEVRAREERQIDSWIRYSVMPVDSATKGTNE